MRRGRKYAQEQRIGGGLNRERGDDDHDEACENGQDAANHDWFSLKEARAGFLTILAENIRAARILEQ